LHGYEPPAEAALPAWQPLENYDESVDVARRLLAEYALNAADDYMLAEHQGDELSKVPLLLQKYVQATTGEDYSYLEANADDYEHSLDAARRPLHDSAPSAAEEYIHPKHDGDAITLARLMLDQNGMEAAANDSFLADAIATVKNLDETHSQQAAAELQAPVLDQLQAPVLDQPDLQPPPAAPAPGSSSSSIPEQDALAQDAATALVPPADPRAPYLDHPGPEAPAAEAQLPGSIESTPEVLPVEPPVLDHDHPTLQAMRKLLEEHVVDVTSAEAPGADIRPAWEAITSTLVTAGALLEGHAAEAASDQGKGAALWSESQESSGLGTGRRLMQAAGAVNVTQLKEEAKQVLLASDSFGVVYSGGNFARAIFALMQPMVAAGQTGTINVDAAYLLNLSQLLAQFIAMLGDLLSKGARLSADGIAPI
jgi:hypothetical protein